MPSQKTGLPFWSTKYLPFSLTLTGYTGSPAREIVKSTSRATTEGLTSSRTRFTPMFESRVFFIQPDPISHVVFRR